MYPVYAWKTVEDTPFMRKWIPRLATREVEDVFLQMTGDERAAYEAVERYIRDTYIQASLDQRNAVGFVMTIYRKRLASSFYALKQTLTKRRERMLAGTFTERG